MPVGTITRGTTNANRLRRVDRWMQTLPALRGSADPLVVDLGYGARGVTTLETAERLRLVRPDVEVLGLEIDPERVRSALETLEDVRRGGTPFSPSSRVSFARGGFEVPGRRPAVIRAFNVLRQYDEAEVADAWTLMTSRLQPGGTLVEGTCDEIGRVCSWVALSPSGPLTLTVSLRLAGLEAPSIVAERLPKALIHRNVEGERVHAFLRDLDRSWARNAAIGAHGAVQRWIATVGAMSGLGWCVADARRRSRLGEITVPWSQVAPAG